MYAGMCPTCEAREFNKQMEREQEAQMEQAQIEQMQIEQKPTATEKPVKLRVPSADGLYWEVLYTDGTWGVAEATQPVNSNQRPTMITASEFVAGDYAAKIARLQAINAKLYAFVSRFGDCDYSEHGDFVKACELMLWQERAEELKAEIADSEPDHR